LYGTVFLDGHALRRARGGLLHHWGFLSWRRLLPRRLLVRKLVFGRLGVASAFDKRAEETLLKSIDQRVGSAARRTIILRSRFTRRQQQESDNQTALQ
jgi:hypothetical protein